VGEQQAFEEYMNEFHGTPDTAYDQADTAIEDDTRIQNLNFREDTVAEGAPVTGDNGDNVLVGTVNADTIDGKGGEDRIAGLAGDDTLLGGAGDDLIEGGDGNDHIDGGADDDVIFGDAGNDILIGGLGNDVIKGNAGNDTFVVTSTADGRDSYDGGDGIDTLDLSGLSQSITLTLKDGATTYATDTIENIENVIGGSAADKLTGNALDNVLAGNAGDDTLKGGAGNDTLDGGEGIDDLDGGAGNDTLLGGAGDDVLKGGAGDDVIKGGAGSDTLTGGAGLDHFVFDSVSDGIDTITDFKISGASEDRIVLSASMFEDFTGDDAFDLIGSGFLRAVVNGNSTEMQIDVDGGGDDFTTLAILTGKISNGILADHVIVQQDPVA
jgi:Ca2+-binding RTX toxin-like protein